jgi:hypothetical protein
MSDLRKLFNDAASKPKNVVVYPKSVEKVDELPTSQSILTARLPYGEVRMAQRQEGQNYIPVRFLYIDFEYSLYVSQVRETRGELVEGVSINLMGYDVAQDAQGLPVYETVPNPEIEQIKQQIEFLKTLKGKDVYQHISSSFSVESVVQRSEEQEAITNAQKIDQLTELLNVTPTSVREFELMTTDKDGNHIEPQILMIFRPQWGVNRTKQAFNRLRTRDMINLVPNRGVPRKTTLISVGSGDASKQEERESIDWNRIHHLQPQMEAPILQYKIELERVQEGLAEDPNDETLKAELVFWQALETIVDKIPIAPNAPSLRQGNESASAPAFSSPVQQAAATIPQDAFAGEPTD